MFKIHVFLCAKFWPPEIPFGHLKIEKIKFRWPGWPPGKKVKVEPCIPKLYSYQNYNAKRALQLSMRAP